MIELRCTVWDENLKDLDIEFQQGIWQIQAYGQDAQWLPYKLVNF
jgi:hypothetical protein